MTSLNQILGQVFEDGDGRSIKIEMAFTYFTEPSFFVLRWMDTDEVYCEYPEIVHLLLECRK